VKIPHIKFHGNPYSGSRAGTCAQTDRQKDAHDVTMRPRTYKTIPWKKTQYGPEFV